MKQNNTITLARIAYTISLILALTSCQHQDLTLTRRADVEVKINWSGLSSEISGSKLNIYLFPTPEATAADPSNTVRRGVYDSADPSTPIESGTFSQVRPGDYRTMTLNAPYSRITLKESTDWDKVELTLEGNDLSLPGGFLEDTDNSAANGNAGLTPPANEYVSTHPDPVIVGKSDYVNIPSTSDKVTMPTIHTTLVTRKINITATGITHFDGIASVRGALSGLSLSYYPGPAKASDTPVTSLFDMTRRPPHADPYTGIVGSDLDGKLLASINTFGTPDPAANIKNILTLYITLKDGSHYAYPFDVTSQMHASSTGDININISDITIKESKKANDVGNISLIDWQEDNLDIAM